MKNSKPDLTQNDENILKSTADLSVIAAIVASMTPPSNTTIPSSYTGHVVFEASCGFDGPQTKQVVSQLNISGRPTQVQTTTDAADVFADAFLRLSVTAPPDTIHINSIDIFVEG